jgi:ABC-2 type transport system permease protein
VSVVAQAAAPRVNLSVVRWVGFKTIVIREYGRIIRIWAQTIVPSAVTAVLYFAIFGSLIGRRVGPMGGFDYKQYIAPGLIMMSVITNSYGNVVASFFGAKFGKHVEELLVSPLPNWVIVGGYIVGGVVRGLLVGAAVTAVSLIFTHLHVEHPLVVVTALLLSSAIFALAGFLNALYAKNFGFLGVSDVHIGAAFALMGGAGLLLFGVCVTLMNRGTGIRE